MSYEGRTILLEIRQLRDAYRSIKQKRIDLRHALSRESKDYRRRRRMERDSYQRLTKAKQDIEAQLVAKVDEALAMGLSKREIMRGVKSRPRGRPRKSGGAYYAGAGARSIVRSLLGGRVGMGYAVA